MRAHAVQQGTAIYKAVNTNRTSADACNLILALVSLAIRQADTIASIMERREI